MGHGSTELAEVRWTQMISNRKSQILSSVLICAPSVAKSASSWVDEHRTFWPRAGPVGGFVPDLGDDRPCGNCGYNLRGLTFDTACPECGAVWGIDPSVEPIA